MDSNNRDAEPNRPTSGQPSTQGNTARPVYKKPVLRRYDQIEQVKPYGPSELEAG
jgi:hypothetical protein